MDEGIRSAEGSTLMVPPHSALIRPSYVNFLNGRTQLMVTLLAPNSLKLEQCTGVPWLLFVQLCLSMDLQPLI